MDKTTAKKIAQLTGVPIKRDFEVIGDFIDECLVTDVNSSITTQLMRLAFQVYVVSRGIEYKYTPADFKAEMCDRLGLNRDDKSITHYDGLRINGAELVE